MYTTIDITQRRPCLYDFLEHWFFSNSNGHVETFSAFTFVLCINVELVEVIGGGLLADRNWDMIDDEFRFEGDVEGENDCYRYSGVNENV